MASVAASGLLSLQLPVTVLLLLLLLALPPPAAAVWYPQQNITGQGTTYCGWYDLQRYTAWCLSPVNAVVASNYSCSFGYCIPLESAANMSCTNKTYCSAVRDNLRQKNFKAEAGCLVLKSAVNGSVALCDVDIGGPSIFDSPPPLYSPPPPSPPHEAKRSNWKLWKTLTLVFSIVGGIAVIVIAVLLIRWFLKRRKQTSSTPVTLLTDEEKAKKELEAQGGGQLGPGVAPGPGGGTGDATATIRPTAPDGRPILAYGSALPPPSPLQAAVTPNGPNQLPPNAGDAIIKAVAESRAAYNGPPLRGPAVTLTPSAGVPSLPPLGPPAGPGGGQLPPGAPAPAVMPAALVPPTAATLQNPTGAS